MFEVVEFYHCRRSGDLITRFGGRIGRPAEGARCIAGARYIVMGIQEHPEFNLLRVLPFNRSSIPALIRAGIHQADWGAGEPSDNLYRVGGAWYELNITGAGDAYLIRYDRLFQKEAIPGLLYGIDPKTGERHVFWKDFDILSRFFPVIREEVDWEDPLFDSFFRPPGPNDVLTEPREVIVAKEVIDLSALGFKRPQWPTRLVTEIIGVGEE